MRLIMELDKDGKVTFSGKVTEEGEEIRYTTIVEILMCAFEYYTKQIIENASKEERAEVHDYMTAIFTTFMNQCFPEEEEFTLTDAAIFKAQDEIVEQALKEDKPIEEMIQEYNRKAAEYVRKVREVS